MRWRASRSAGTALFYAARLFPGAYRGGAFITQHDRCIVPSLPDTMSVFIFFRNGKNRAEKRSSFSPASFCDEEKSKVYGRPVGLAMLGGWVGARSGRCRQQDLARNVWSAKIA